MTFNYIMIPITLPSSWSTYIVHAQLVTNMINLGLSIGFMSISFNWWVDDTCWVRMTILYHLMVQW